MRRPLTAAALVLGVAAFVPASPAHAYECDRYGDKPCVVLREVLDEWCDTVNKLVVEPVPEPICT
jgi:hypothetical protein